MSGWISMTMVVATFLLTPLPLPTPTTLPVSDGTPGPRALPLAPALLSLSLFLLLMWPPYLTQALTVFSNTQTSKHIDKWCLLIYRLMDARNHTKALCMH